MPKNLEANLTHDILNILVIGDKFEDSFVDNIIETLKLMGFNVAWAPANVLTNTKNVYARLLASYARKAFPGLEPFAQRSMLKVALQFDPDLIINTHSGVSPEAIASLKNQTNALIVCWYTDSIANLSRQYLLASDYDIWFFKEPYMVNYFKKKLGLNTRYLPEACNPIWHCPTTVIDEHEYNKYKADISLAGNMYYYRSTLLEELSECDIKIWGPIFPSWLNSPTRKYFQNEYLTRINKAKAFGLAKVNLNTTHYTEIDGVNCRLFEIAGCGGFQIVDLKSSIVDLFEVGKEIETFESIGELKEKVAYYLDHEKERKDIAINSYKRAHKDHTYEIRLRALIEEVQNHRVEAG